MYKYIYIYIYVSIHILSSTEKLPGIFVLQFLTFTFWTKTKPVFIFQFYRDK